MVARARRLMAHARSLGVFPSIQEDSFPAPQTSNQSSSLAEITADEFAGKATRWLGDPGVEHDAVQLSLEEMDGKLTGRRVVVTKAYFGETGSGYLNLQPGDQVKVMYDRIEAPGPDDRHSGYVYGQLLSASAGDTKGWLPTDVVRFE